MNEHAPIVDGLLLARAARAAGHDEAAEHLIATLRAVHGPEAVRAAAIALDTTPTAAVRHG